MLNKRKDLVKRREYTKKQFKKSVQKYSSIFWWIKYPEGQDALLLILLALALP
jgi:hypothetical protein